MACDKAASTAMHMATACALALYRRNLNAASLYLGIVTERQQATQSCSCTCSVCRSILQDQLRISAQLQVGGSQARTETASQALLCPSITWSSVNTSSKGYCQF